MLRVYPSQYSPLKWNFHRENMMGKWWSTHGFRALTVTWLCCYINRKKSQYSSSKSQWKNRGVESSSCIRLHPLISPASCCSTELRPSASVSALVFAHPEAWQPRCVSWENSMENSWNMLDLFRVALTHYKSSSIIEWKPWKNWLVLLYLPMFSLVSGVGATLMLELLPWC